MKNVIVATTIHPLSEALRKFDAMPDWHLVVVGDLKTPDDFKLERGDYLSPADQERFDKPLSDAIGWNCIQRRNIGLLAALESGAEVVALVDDDNIPHADWGRDLCVDRECSINMFHVDAPAFDPVGATNYPQLWHRGFPLQLVPTRSYLDSKVRRVTAQVQADFWNCDPDVDAICRMVHGPRDCRFDPDCFPIAGDKIAPFNSQNTFLSASILDRYFLFPQVGRMDDIWAAYHAQAKGITVAFGKASVDHRRNTHDVIADMRHEYLGYEKSLALVEAVTRDSDAIAAFVPARSMEAFSLYRRHFRAS
jgi:hypothetical protein